MDEPVSPKKRLDATLSDEDSAPPVSGKMRPWLFVVHGNDRAHHVKLGETAVTLGRGPGADVVLNDDRASKVHCSVRVGPGDTVEVVDLGSRNGTFVDGERIEKATLRPNSQLRVGHTILRLEHKAIDQVRLEEELFHAAVTDVLTGIPNRRWFQERASAAMIEASRHGHPLAAVFIDIDHFKQINDKLGHETGDLVLKEVAKRIDAARRAEDLLCRYGGEEFVLLLPHADLAQASTYGERVRAAVAAVPFQIKGEALTVTISVGVACHHFGDPLEPLLKRADQAMYRAKEGGRNRVVTEE
ncbi:MAG TPA: GGDEF domain-containing protein [Planctomycetota bacterium]|jgi:diguanylate cyclase (GGDEF)-like protein|nr:GGDEF domain-containing protein [Planctomycetota bacterium]